MPTALLAWIGLTDIKAMRGDSSAGLGPIGQAVGARSFDIVLLLADCPEEEAKQFDIWLAGHTSAKILRRPVKLTSPTNFGEIFEAAVGACEAVRELGGTDVDLTFHLSPGTPAMAAVWILLAKTRFPAELIESSRDHGVKTATVPFDLSLDFIPDLLREQDARLRADSAAEPPSSPEFAEILHRSGSMKRVLERARRVALHSVPVLIEGESGTGKELLARAIHGGSPRRHKEFIAVNCGAIPPGLIDSELFGHRKGAYSGAIHDRAGYFESADKGTLFLDEIGELPREAQVRLLRVLQEGVVIRVGSTTPVPVDVRIIAATNRSLTSEIAAGTFRDDLFFRLAVAVLTLPPLRERQGDLGFLIDQLFRKITAQGSKESGQKQKILSAGAKNVLQNHSWPGNVRELVNTLTRLVIWADGTSITADDARETILQLPKDLNNVNGRVIGDGFSLQDLLKQTASHYLARAMDEAHGNKTKAAELLGLPSYQTLTNWLSRYEVKC